MRTPWSSPPRFRDRACFARSSLLGLLLAGCAAGAHPADRPTPERIPSLESRVASNPGDADARIQLSASYRAAGRPADALRVLEPVREREAGNNALAFHAALAHEDLEQWAEARRSYERFLALGGPRSLERRVRGRLALLQRRELEAAVRLAVAREQELAGTTPSVQTIGVFPFLSGDDELRPLSRALAELLTTDLAQTDRLTVVERSQVQALLDELALAESGRVDPATAARAGRLLSAGRIVQGRIDGVERVRLQAFVVPVAQPAPGEPQQAEGALSSVIDLEKQIAIGLYAAMGIQLTQAERERVLRRPTENVQALLAFGFGLESSDGGRWTEAVGHFQRAVQLDPAFEPARQHLERAQLQADGEADSTEELAEAGFLDLALDWTRRRLRFADVDRLVPDPQVRDPVPEVLGVEGLDRRGLLEIIIRRPGGN